jgi:asparagine synthetase B (glutamine-hydrolysing)
MSGIAACFDPDGVDVDRLAEACGRAAYRGNPTIELVSATTAVAVLARSPHRALWSRSERSVLAMDGRVDAFLRMRVVADAGTSGIDVLHTSLDEIGADALNDFAAEFALALASTLDGSMLVARDVFGLHPLYTASRGRSVGFASDPQILMALGLASDELDADVVASYLARIDPTEGRTAFHDVREVLPGSWMRVDAQGRTASGRWFEPERLEGPRLSGPDAVEATRAAVRAAVRSRGKDRRCAVALSGGRDSGSIAVAAAMEGIEATGITQSFDDDLPVHEEHLARELCRRWGLRWSSAPVTGMPTWEELENVPTWSGTPLTHWAFPQALAVPKEAASEGVDVLLTGEGGEPMFTGSDLIALDLLRRARIISSARAARAFRRVWGHSYGRQVKVAARAILPRWLLAIREGMRPVPPWVADRVTRTLSEDDVATSDKAAFLAALRSDSPTGYEPDERISQFCGIDLAHPFLDLRVVSVAMSLSLADRAPIEQPKPMLAAAFLGRLAAGRVKMSFVPYYERLARNLHERYPVLFAPGSSLASAAGLVDPRGLPAVHSDAWRMESLGLAVLELWLRRAL